MLLPRPRSPLNERLILTLKLDEKPGDPHLLCSRLNAFFVWIDPKSSRAKTTRKRIFRCIGRQTVHPHVSKNLEDSKC
jgi:hypothetical protein